MPEALWDAVDQYLDETLCLTDEALEHAVAASHAAGLPDIQVSPTQGRFLQILAASIGARRILEIGTLGGYSAICLARSLPRNDPDARLVTLEYQEKHAKVARANLEHAGLQGLVEVRVGRALDLLPQVEKDFDLPFDLAFIDADKENNGRYFDWALRLVRVGGLIVVDNVVRRGGLANANSQDPGIRGSRELFERVQKEPRVSATALQTVGVKGYDGFALIRVLSP
jgi:predicted O-methyltransferase YrrM